MLGSSKWQATTLLKESGLYKIGEGKHAAKEEARARGARTWAEMGKALGVHSYKTAATYKNVWSQLLDHAKQQHPKVKDMEKLSKENVESFLLAKLEQNVAHQTFITYCAAILKMESCLNALAAQKATGRTYDFGELVDALRDDANRTLIRFTGMRAYELPEELVAVIMDPMLQLAARVQLEGGARISEAAVIRDYQLKGLLEDPYTGIEKGKIQLKGKGGKIYDIMVKPDTYRELLRVIAERGKFEIEHHAYYRELHLAAMATNQKYQGSHGLRWNFARRRMGEVKKAGVGCGHALSIISKAMGHERGDITLHYTGSR